jgi:hypothetical protein
VGGEREKHFHLFKTWANRYVSELRAVLTDRYLMYGEWVYARHTIFYTDLPHYFLEFDIYDKVTGQFMDTESRRRFLDPLPFVVSVKVLQEGSVDSLAALARLIGPSHFIAPDHRQRLREICRERNLDADQVLRESDPTGLMEGLYIKVEEGGIVRERYKYVRASFLTAVLDSGSHWLSRPIIPNGLRPDAVLF